LAPLYHAALAADLAKPVAVLNLGAWGNVTWIGQAADEILAFDTGPGECADRRLVRTHTGRAAGFRWCPRARRPGFGTACRALSGLAVFRSRTAEISRPRRFQGTIPNDLGVADGAATLTEMTAASVAAATRYFPRPAREWLVCGGGRTTRRSWWRSPGISVFR